LKDEKVRLGVSFDYELPASMWMTWRAWKST
jgi:hypothetical protein